MALQRILFELYAPIPSGAEVAIVELVNNDPGFLDRSTMFVLLDRTNRIVYGDDTFRSLCYEKDPTGVLVEVMNGAQPVDHLAALIPPTWAVGRTQTVRIASAVATMKTWGDHNEARTALYFMSDEARGYRG